MSKHTNPHLLPLIGFTAWLGSFAFAMGRNSALTSTQVLGWTVVILGFAVMALITWRHADTPAGTPSERTLGLLIGAFSVFLFGKYYSAELLVLLVFVVGDVALFRAALTGLKPIGQRRQRSSREPADNIGLDILETISENQPVS